MALAELYRSHLAEQLRRADAALARGGFDHLLIPSGMEHYGFLDDQNYPFRSNPHFLAWVPLNHHPGSWISYTPGQRPVLAISALKGAPDSGPGTQASSWALATLAATE